ncbi:MAG: BlaI/MecI/CopY family transcriptional regulator [Candidatus Eremiobacteraeota bacterium]|nr:BlaI/MecI/CopY family transcriptional regulator [Candidatus Eremiobacteraeota bacterium]MBV8355156.1 BlaI/MecI/CopY family transcriptional regulator [Candidatus Eremiobacteraeota bacterium]
MPRKKSTTLADSELRLMEILWSRGASTVAEVLAGLPQETPLAFNSVQTTLRILEQKGYVKHTESGRAFVYHAVVDRAQASRSAVDALLARFFKNSPGELALNLVESQHLDASTRARLAAALTEVAETE